MSKKLLTTVTIIILTTVCAFAQMYVAPPVTVSKDKVKIEGKAYYTHVVLERQTLYSISKAYNVPIEEIYAANEAIGLRENGLKKNSIILIPAKQKNRKDRSEKAEADSADVIARNGGVQQVLTAEPSVGMLQPCDTVIADRPWTMPVEEVADITLAIEESDSSFIADSVGKSKMLLSPKKDVHLALMLPIRLNSGKGSQNYMDFYSGALLAARERGLQGIDIDLSVFDTGKGIPDLTEEQCNWLDAVIGPVYSDEMEKLLSAMPDSIPVISPMDPRTEELCRTHKNVIQIHHGCDAQATDLVKWIESDLEEGERVIIVYETGKEEIREKIASLLEEKGIEFQDFSYGILQGRNAMNTIRAKMAKGVVNRLILASENEAFTNDALKNASMAANSGFKVVMYAMSKAKTYDTTDPLTMHGASLHLTAQYDIDYEDTRVKDFILKYRGVFKTEPNAFAYQGYDLIWYFTGIISEYGDNWPCLFTGKRTKLLQTDLEFERISPEGGLINNALRHEVYIEDFKTEFLDQ